MRRFTTALLAAGFLAVFAFAGALTLQIDDMKSVPDAKASGAVIAAHITACNSPEKTVVTAKAEGILDGRRQSIPLHVIRLAEPGAFAVKREWPNGGRWTVTMIATNPEYRNYATSVVVPIRQDGDADRAAAKVFYHAPTAAEVNSVLALE
jgi:hypothetical protein